MDDPELPFDALYEDALRLRDAATGPEGLAALAPGWPFEEEELIEEGGMKRIYRALDRRTGRHVARAEMRQAGADPGRFLREARITALLQHPNIVPVYDIGLNPAGQPYFVMKLSEGRNLDQLIGEWRHQAPSLEHRLDLFSRITDAIAYAHHRGVIHLDLKPANIQVDLYGEVLVCDWGLARILDEVCDDPLLLEHSVEAADLRSLTSDGYIKGSLGYMSPEQAGGPKTAKDQRSDLFSLGAILYALLVFDAPFRGSAEEILADTRRGRFQPLLKSRPADANPASIRAICLKLLQRADEILADTRRGRFQPLLESRPADAIPASLEAICRKLLQREPQQRYPDVLALQADIAAYRHGFAPQAEQATWSKLMRLTLARHKATSATLGISILILLLGSAWFVRSLRHKERAALAAKDQVERSELALRQEQERSHSIGITAAPRYYDMAYDADINYDLPRAAMLSNLAVELDPGLDRAWGVKGLMHFIHQDFAQADLCYGHYLLPAWDFMKPWSSEFARRKGDKPELAMPDLLELMDRLNARTVHVFNRMLIVYCQTPHPDAERLIFVRHLLKLRNPKIQQLHCELQAERLDLSGNPELQWIEALMHFPVRHLNLAGSGVSDLKGLRGMPLEDLDLANNPVQDLLPLAALPLRRLSLAGCPVQDLAPLSPCPLIELDLRACPVKDLQVLKNLDLQELKWLGFVKSAF